MRRVRMPYKRFSPISDTFLVTLSGSVFRKTEFFNTHERFHETLKARMNLLVYTSPDELRRTMQDFIEYYNHRRYHEAIGNVSPADVYYGRREGILRRRAEQKQRTIEQRLHYNLSR